MCIKTYNQLMQRQESFLRKHYLFEMLIFEIYNTLQSFSPSSLNTVELFSELSHFLKARISFIMHSQTDGYDLFKTHEEIIKYIADLLADKIFSIHVKNGGYYYEQVEK